MSNVKQVKRQLMRGVLGAFALTLLSLFPMTLPYAHSETINGRVSGAQPGEVAILLDGKGSAVQIGDKVELYFTIPGVDEEVVAGRGEVKKIEGSSVIASLAAGAGKIQPGFKARVITRAGQASSAGIAENKELKKKDQKSTEPSVKTNSALSKVTQSPPVKTKSTLSKGAESPGSLSKSAVAKGPVWIGISTADLSREHLRQAGLDRGPALAVVFAYPGSPAEISGLFPGDIVLRIDGEAVSSADSMDALLYKKGVGRVVELEISRRGVAPFNLYVKTESTPSPALKLSRLRAAAERGDPFFEYMMAEAYRQGYVVERSTEKALQWLMRAAEHGNQDARAEIARLHFFEPYSGVRNSQAESWLIGSAESGNGRALYMLGVLYLQGVVGGRGVDNVKAFDSFRRSADANDPDGTASFGSMYENGIGVARDLRQASSLYQRAAALGSSSAVESLRRIGH